MQMANLLMNFKPTKTLREFHLSNARYRWVIGPYGRSKTFSMIMECLIRAMQHPPGKDGVRRTRVAIVRNTVKSLQQSVVPDIQALLGKIARYKQQAGEFHIRFPGVESTWLLIPLETQADERRLLSLQITFGWVAEFREVDYDLAVALAGRTGRFPPPDDGEKPNYWSGIFGESNPMSMSSDWYEHLVVSKPDDWLFLQQPSGLSVEAENLDHLRDGYYQDLSENRNEEWVNVHVHGKFGEDQRGKAVFKDSFRMSFHVTQLGDAPLRFNRELPLMVGLDTGRCPAAVFMQEDPWGRVLLLGECFIEGAGMETFLATKVKPYIAKHFPGARVIIGIDPAARQRSQIGEESVVGAVRRLGFEAVIAPTNDIQPRLRVIEKLLLQQRDGKAALLIDRRMCPDLVKAFVRDYRYAKNKLGNVDEKPSKDHNSSDLMDSLGYILLVSGMSYTAKVIGRLSRGFTATTGSQSRSQSQSPPNSMGWT